jgi:hypothetical protein
MGEPQQTGLGKDVYPRFHREQADIAAQGEGFNSACEICGGSPGCFRNLLLVTCHYLPLIKALVPDFRANHKLVMPNLAVTHC